MNYAECSECGDVFETRFLGDPMCSRCDKNSDANQALLAKRFAEQQAVRRHKRHKTRLPWFPWVWRQT